LHEFFTWFAFTHTLILRGSGSVGLVRLPNNLDSISQAHSGRKTTLIATMLHNSARHCEIKQNNINDILFPTTAPAY
jgi:hypothetical protein